MYGIEQSQILDNSMTHRGQNTRKTANLHKMHTFMQENSKKLSSAKTAVKLERTKKILYKKGLSTICNDSQKIRRTNNKNNLEWGQSIRDHSRYIHL